MSEQIEGFVLSITEYREHDAFIRFLSKEHGLINLVLPGYYKANSKQSRLGLEFSKVSYKLKYRENSLNRIHGGQLIEGFFHQREDFDWLLDASLLSELIIKLYIDEYKDDLYESYSYILSSEDRAKNISVFLFNLSKYHGIQAMLDSCVICGSTKINSFSINDAGFLCNVHSVKKDRVDLLELLVYLNRGIDLDFEDSSYLSFIDLYIKYLSFYADVNIHSWKLKTRI